MRQLTRVLALMSFVIFTTLFAVVALAADPAPTLEVGITNLVSAIKIGTLGGILLASGQLLKTPFFTALIGQVNTKAMPYITLVLGVVISVGESLIAGKPWYLGVIEGAVAAFASNKVYDNYKTT